MEVQNPPGFQTSTIQAQFVQPMFMPYIEVAQDGLDSEW